MFTEHIQIKAKSVRKSLVTLGLSGCVALAIVACGARSASLLQPQQVSAPFSGQVVAVATPRSNSANNTANPVVTLPQVTASSDVFSTDPGIAAVKKVKPATVTVVNRGTQGSGIGSGVIVSDAGYIITNNHVVEGARTLQVIYDDGEQVSATLVGTTPEFDLAVIRVTGTVPVVAQLGDSSAVPQGARVLAIGSALGGFRNTVTSGVLSGHNRTLGDLNGLLQTDAPINHGNSGGPLIDLSGEVIGINTLVLRGSSTDQAEGLGFAIPSNTVRAVANQLISKGKVERPFLGVTSDTLNPQIAADRGIQTTQGVVITDVTAGTAAAKAGLRQGDVIVAVAGQPMDDQHPLAQILLQHSVGEQVNITVARGTQTLTVPVTLGARPAGA